MNQFPITTFSTAPVQIIDGDRGKNYPNLNEFNSTGHCLFLNAKNVTPNGFDFTQCMFISKEKDEILRKGKLLPNDVVLTTRGTIGNVAYFRDSAPFSHVRINSGMVIFRCNSNEISPLYLYYFMKSPSFHAQVNSLRSGVAQPQLPIRDINRIKLPLPKLPIQNQISSIILNYDNLIENNRRRIELLEKAAHLLYKEWFIKQRFPNHQTTPATDDLPEGWEKKKLETLVKMQRGRSYSSAELKDKNGADFVNLKCMQRFGGYRQDGLKRFTGKFEEKHVVNAGDILIALTDMTREAMVVAQALRIPISIGANAVFSMDLVKVIPDNEADRNWLYMLLRNSSFSNEVKEYANGTTVLHLKPKYIVEWEGVIPSANIRKQFSDVIAPILSLQDQLEMQNQKLAQARDMLLPKLVGGHLF